MKRSADLLIVIYDENVRALRLSAGHVGRSRPRMRLLSRCVVSAITPSVGVPRIGYARFIGHCLAP